MLPPPRDIEQGGSSAQIRSTDTSAQTQPGNALHFMMEPDKPNPRHSVPWAQAPRPAESEQHECNPRRE